MSGLPASFGETAQQKHRSGDQRSLEVDAVSAPPYAVRDGTVVPDQRLSLSRSPTDKLMCDSRAAIDFGISIALRRRADQILVGGKHE